MHDKYHMLHSEPVRMTNGVEQKCLGDTFSFVVARALADRAGIQGQHDHRPAR